MSKFNEIFQRELSKLEQKPKFNTTNTSSQIGPPPITSSRPLLTVATRGVNIVPARVASLKYKRSMFL